MVTILGISPLRLLLLPLYLVYIYFFCRFLVRASKCELNPRSYATDVTSVIDV
jgi:hypothetical protein